MNIYKNIEYSREVGEKFSINQGDLAYIMHPNNGRCGWYMKLRKASNKKTGYFQITGEQAGYTFIISGGLEYQHHGANIDSRAVLFVRGGENVAEFIASGYTKTSVIEDPKLRTDIRRLEKMKHDIKILEENIEKRRRLEVEDET